LKDEDGIEAEVIDLRSLVPLDTGTVVESVRKTSRALVVHEDKIFGGFGGEIASQITENCFDCLDAPVLRVGSEHSPVPFSKILEREVLPNVEDIVNRALELSRY
jgi:2-oxoisovalerate dehydrogenase E1 component